MINSFWFGLALIWLVLHDEDLVFHCLMFFIMTSRKKCTWMMATAEHIHE